MKKLLTGISGILLFPCLTTGFTTPVTTKVITGNHVNKSGTAPRFYHLKWQHTSWVNPLMRSFADPTVD